MHESRTSRQFMTRGAGLAKCSVERETNIRKLLAAEQALEDNRQKLADLIAETERLVNLPLGCHELEPCLFVGGERVVPARLDTKLTSGGRARWPGQGHEHAGGHPCRRGAANA